MKRTQTNQACIDNIRIGHEKNRIDLFTTGMPYPPPLESTLNICAALVKERPASWITSQACRQLSRKTTDLISDPASRLPSLHLPAFFVLLSLALTILICSISSASEPMCFNNIIRSGVLVMQAFSTNSSIWFNLQWGSMISNNNNNNNNNNNDFWTFRVLQWSGGLQVWKSLSTFEYIYFWILL